MFYNYLWPWQNFQPFLKRKTDLRPMTKWWKKMKGLSNSYFVFKKLERIWLVKNSIKNLIGQINLFWKQIQSARKFKCWKITFPELFEFFCSYNLLNSNIQCLLITWSDGTWETDTDYNKIKNILVISLRLFCDFKTK